MRIPDGLDRAGLEAFERTLLTSHYIRTRVDVLDRDEQPIARFRPRVLGGSVDVDTSTVPTRSGSLEIVDAHRELNFAPSSSSDAAAFADTFLAVSRETWVPALGKWISTPLICGPIAKLARAGAVLSIEIDGKEILGVKPAVIWTDDAKTLPKGTGKIAAIRSLMRAQGERKFDLPETPTAKLAEKITLDRLAEPWIVANKIARSMHMQLFYDGAGYLRLRRKPADRVFSFRTAPLKGWPTNVLTRPDKSYDLTAVRNIYEVLGPAPEGKAKKRLRHAAKATGPLSPTALQRNGEPRWLVESVELSEAKREPEVVRAARDGIAITGSVAVETAFDALVAPHLEEDDPVTLYDEEEALTFNLRKFSIPLSASDVMTINTNRRVRSRRAKA